LISLKSLDGICKISLGASYRRLLSCEAYVSGLQYTEVRLLLVELCTAYLSEQVLGSGFRYPHLTWDTLTHRGCASALITPVIAS
jgi:hypothetical protein